MLDTVLSATDTEMCSSQFCPQEDQHRLVEQMDNKDSIVWGRKDK